MTLSLVTPDFKRCWLRDLLARLLAPVPFAKKNAAHFAKWCGLQTGLYQIFFLQLKKNLLSANQSKIQLPKCFVSVKSFVSFVCVVL